MTQTMMALLATIISRQPTIHLLRSSIVPWLQSEFSITTSEVNSNLARNRLLRTSPLLFLSHRPNDVTTTTRQRSSSSLPPRRRSHQHHHLQKKHLERISHQVYTTCSHQMGWRCVPSCVGSTASANSNHSATTMIITSKDRKEVWDLSQRAGATSNVMAVGSTAAMYLAKSMTTTDHDIIEHATTASATQQQRILIPLTYEAVWASTTSHILLLSHPFSPLEPMFSALPATITTTPVMIVLDPCSIWDNPDDRKVAYQAAIALALDAMYWHLVSSNNSSSPKAIEEELPWKPILTHWIQQQQQQHPPKETSIIDHEDGNNKELITTVLQALAIMGGCTRFGLSESPPIARSIPLAIAASLVPRILLSLESSASSPTLSSSTAQANPPSTSTSFQDDSSMLLLRIMASLVPGLLRLVVDKRENRAVINHNSNDDDDDDDDGITKLQKNLTRLEEEESFGNDVDSSTPSTRSFYSLTSPLLSSRQDHVAPTPDDEESLDLLMDITMELVQENREHWNCQDAEDSILEQVVNDSF
jgi:hypothetical protein